MNYKTMKIEDIISWCKANKQTEWLKDTATKLVPYKVYPTTTIEVDGKAKVVPDKSQTPTTEMRPISFIQIKLAFCEKFMPEIMPKAKPKKKNMYDLIAEL